MLPDHPLQPAGAAGLYHQAPHPAGHPGRGGSPGTYLGVHGCRGVGEHPGRAAVTDPTRQCRMSRPTCPTWSMRGHGDGTGRAHEDPAEGLRTGGRRSPRPRLRSIPASGAAAAWPSRAPSWRPGLKVPQHCCPGPAGKSQDESLEGEAPSSAADRRPQAVGNHHLLAPSAGAGWGTGCGLEAATCWAREISRQ